MMVTRHFLPICVTLWNEAGTKPYINYGGFIYVQVCPKNLGTSLLHSIWYKLEHDLVVVGIAGLQYGIDFFLGMFWSRINKAILIDPICLKLFIGLPVNSWHNLF